MKRIFGLVLVLLLLTSFQNLKEGWAWPFGPQGSGSGTSGADASGYYVVTRSTNAPTNAANLGAGTTGLVFCTVAGSVCTFSVKAIGTDVQAYDATLAAIAAAGNVGAAYGGFGADMSGYTGLVWFTAGVPSQIAGVDNGILSYTTAGGVAFRTAFSFNSDFYLFDKTQGTTTPKKMMWDTSASEVSTTFTLKSHIHADHFLMIDMSGATATKNPTMLFPITLDRSYTWLDTSGTVPLLQEVVEHDDQTQLTAAQMQGGTFSNAGQGAADLFLLLPVAAANLSGLFTVGTAQAGNHFGVEAAANDKIYLVASDGTVTAGNDNAAVVMTAAQVGQSFACWTFCTAATDEACTAWDWQCKAISIGTSTFAAHAHSTP